MSDFVKFLTDYKDIILLVVSIALTIVLIFVKRKPQTIDDFKATLDEVLLVVPELVSGVEEAGKGEEKKAKVISACLSLMIRSLHRQLTNKESAYVKKAVSEQIESVLKAPQKKLCSE